jgi:hypothetical protein
MMKTLLEENGAMATSSDGPRSSEITEVKTFTECDYRKPVGLRVTFGDESQIFVQFVRTSPPAGASDDQRADYTIPEGRL